MIVLVTLERRNPDQPEVFKKLMRNDEAVTQCYLVTGSMDFVLVVAVEDMEGFLWISQNPEEYAKVCAESGGQDWARGRGA